MTIEYRNAVGGVGGDGRTLVGLVTPFDTWTTIGDKKRGGFDERMAPGAFTKTLREQDVVLIHDHNTAMPMARTSITEGPGRLTLAPDPSAGLRADAEPVETTYAKDVLKLAKAKVLRGMSFGFEVIKDSWTDDDGNPSDQYRGTKRTVHEVRLHEVTTTAFPAYPTTELSARDSINAARGVDKAREERADGPLPYADPKNEKYPVGDKPHAKAAWAYINMPKNAAEYPMNGVTLSEVKDRIKAALKKFGVEISEENAADLALEYRSELLTEARAHIEALEDENDSAEAEETEPVETTPDEEEREHLKDLAIAARYGVPIPE